MTEVEEKARILIEEVTKAIENGTRHYRKSDGKLLTTTREVLEALRDEKEIIFEPAANRN